MMAVNQLKKIIGTRRWYHQGFDATPLLLGYIGEGEVARESRKPKGMEGNYALCFYSHGHADWYFDVADLTRGTDIMIAEVQKNPALATDLRAQWVDDERRFEELFTTFDSEVLRTLDDEKLQELYQQYYQATVARYTSTSLIDHFALGSDRVIADMIRAECGPFATESEFSTVFAVLTAPVFQSFMHDADLALMDIALHETPEQIDRYRKQFFWKRNNYVSSYQLTSEDVRAELHQLKAATPNVAAARDQLLALPKHAAEKKAHYIARHPLSLLLKSLLALSDTWCQWQDERKRATLMSTAIFDSFLQEFGRRMSLDHELLKYVLPSEMNDVVRHGSVIKEQLLRRVELCAVLYTPDGITIFDGEEARQLQDAMNQSVHKNAPTTISGLIAHTGVATGRVRVLTSAKECDQMQHGEVLVAVMTRPDYLPAMKKAVAIVTDEGGITCHAAIVSRELRIPCIIGTGNATTQLRTGDRVCVDANANSVTLL